MIVRPRPHWLRMLFVWRGSVLPAVLLLMVGEMLGEPQPATAAAPATPADDIQT